MGEMNELFDKQVNVQKESLKKFLGFTSPHKPTQRKCVMKMKQRKNNIRINIVF